MESESGSPGLNSGPVTSSWARGKSTTLSKPRCPFLQNEDTGSNQTICAWHLPVWCPLSTPGAFPAQWGLGTWGRGGAGGDRRSQAGSVLPAESPMQG